LQRHVVDIVGFTKMSSVMPPEQLVRFLDQIFSDFDELTSSAGLEKIKTMGDAYMVAAGIPDPRADHAAALVRLAMEMQAVIRRHGLHIRCGINSGNVVAGVIGRKKFIYDLWGDTVNVASRMESQGLSDQIQVTESTASLIRDQFDLERRADIDIKGKGMMPVYLVTGVTFRPSPH
jgi:class 3 adenylate cyclase